MLHIGTPRPVKTCTVGIRIPDQFKLVHYVTSKPIGKLVVGLRLKGLLSISISILVMLINHCNYYVLKINYKILQYLSVKGSVLLS